MKGSERRQSQSRANQCRADLKSLRKSIEQVRQRAIDFYMAFHGSGQTARVGSGRVGSSDPT